VAFDDTLRPSAAVFLVSESAAERKRRRALAEVRVFCGTPDHAEEMQRDAVYWLRIPIEKRAEFVWELSVEAFSRRAAR